MKKMPIRREERSERNKSKSRMVGREHTYPTLVVKVPG